MEGDGRERGREGTEVPLDMGGQYRWMMSGAGRRWNGIVGREKVVEAHEKQRRADREWREGEMERRLRQRGERWKDLGLALGFPGSAEGGGGERGEATEGGRRNAGLIQRVVSRVLFELGGVEFQRAVEDGTAKQTTNSDSRGEEGGTRRESERERRQKEN